VAEALVLPPGRQTVSDVLISLVSAGAFPFRGTHDALPAHEPSDRFVTFDRFVTSSHSYPDSSSQLAADPRPAGATRKPTGIRTRAQS
jgi:hypothetical protein